MGGDVYQHWDLVYDPIGVAGLEGEPPLYYGAVATVYEGLLLSIAVPSNVNKVESDCR